MPQEKYLTALWFLTCNIHGLVILLREICGLSIYWEPGAWVMTAAGDYIGGT